MSALNLTSFKGNHIGGIKDNTGVFFTSAECTFLPRLEGISVYLFVIEMMSVFVGCWFTHVVAQRFTVAPVGHCDTHQSSVLVNVRLGTVWVCTLTVC